MHKDKKLAAIIPQHLNYHFGKILEATSSKNSFDLGRINLEVIGSILMDIKDELLSRGEWDESDHISYHYDLIEYPKNRLLDYFNCEDAMNEKEAFIFASFIVEQINELKKILGDVDKTYETEL